MKWKNRFGLKKNVHYLLCYVRTGLTFLIDQETFGITCKLISYLKEMGSIVQTQLAFKQSCTSHLALHQWLTPFESNPVAFDAAVCCECSLLYEVLQPPFTQLSGFSFKMRTRLTVCVGTGGPHGQEGGLLGLEQGGVEERGPTETEERRQTGQPSKASNSKLLIKTGRRTFTWHRDSKTRGYLACIINAFPFTPNN